MKKYAYVIFEIDEDVREGTHLTSNRRRRYGNESDTPKQYVFDSLSITDLEPNDLVVVETQHGIRLAKFVTYTDNLPERMNKDIVVKSLVSKVDMTAFEAHKVKIARMKELKREMDTMIESLKEQAVYEMMAEKDDGLAKTLAEYKSLLGE